MHMCGSILIRHKNVTLNKTGSNSLPPPHKNTNLKWSDWGRFFYAPFFPIENFLKRQGQMQVILFYVLSPPILNYTK